MTNQKVYFHLQKLYMHDYLLHTLEQYNLEENNMYYLL